MSQGFVCRNDLGGVIISDVSATLYFVGKATVTTTVAGLTNTNAALTCGTTYTYTLGVLLDYPIVYVSYPTGICALLRIYKTGTTFFAEIIAKGGTTVPEVYVFSKKPAYAGTEKYGMKIARSDLTEAYDSRNGRILNVKSNQPVSFAPNNATLAVSIPYTFKYLSNLYSYRESSARYNLDINAYTNYVIPTCTKPAVAINTVAICNRFFQWAEYIVEYVWDGWGYYFYGDQITYYTNTAIYRGGFKIINNSNVQSCWVPHVVAENFNRSTYLAGGDPLVNWNAAPGTAPGGYSYGNTGGTVPYLNTSINLTGGNMSVIDAAQYD